jgi:hypothetical protein
VISTFWQTDSRLEPEVQQYGCALLDCCYLLPDEFTPAGVNELYAEYVERGLIKMDCTILSWARVLGAMLSAESVDKYPLQFSRIAGASYQCDDDEREILKGSLSNIGGYHFVIGNGKPFIDVATNVLWDSMNNPRVMNAYWSFVEKVIVKVI